MGAKKAATVEKVSSELCAVNYAGETLVGSRRAANAFAHALQIGADPAQPRRHRGARDIL